MSIAGFIIGLIYNSFIQTPRYKSGATLIIIKNDDTTSKNSTLINNYIRLFKSRKVLEPTIKDLKLDSSYDELASSIEATNDTDTEVVKLAVTSNNAKTSQEILNHAIVIFKDEAKSLYKKDNIQIVDSASFESKPYNVNAVMQLLVATGIGFSIPVIIIFFIYDIKFNMSKNNSDDKDNNDESMTDKNITPDDNPNPPTKPTEINDNISQNTTCEKIIEKTAETNQHIKEPIIAQKTEPQTQPQPQHPISIIRSFNIPDRRR